MHKTDMISSPGGPPRWRQIATHLCLLFMFALLWCVPLLSRGIPDLSHDGATHANRQVVFSNQLWNGEWYPRWLTDANSGLGSPSFFFYPSIPSYAASLFRPLLAARDRDGWLQAGYGCVLAILLSAAAAYFWLRSLTRPTAALCGACVYILAPYHLAIDTYVRGAAAELWGFVWLPLILLCVEGIRTHARWAPLGLAVAFALLAMAHLPTVILFYACHRCGRIAARWRQRISKDDPQSGRWSGYRSRPCCDLCRACSGRSMEGKSRPVRQRYLRLPALLVIPQLRNAFEV